MIRFGTVTASSDAELTAEIGTSWQKLHDAVLGQGLLRPTDRSRSYLFHYYLRALIRSYAAGSGLSIWSITQPIESAI